MGSCHLGKYLWERTSHNIYVLIVWFCLFDSKRRNRKSLDKAKTKNWKRGAKRSSILLSQKKSNDLYYYTRLITKYLRWVNLATENKKILIVWKFSKKKCFLWKTCQRNSNDPLKKNAIDDSQTMNPLNLYLANNNVDFYFFWKSTFFKIRFTELPKKDLTSETTVQNLYSMCPYISDFQQLLLSCFSLCWIIKLAINRLCLRQKTLETSDLKSFASSWQSHPLGVTM